MKKDKIVVVLIICIALAATGVLQNMRSHDSKVILPYLTALESSLNVFGKGKTNEFYSLHSELEPVMDDKVIPIAYFVEELLILEEFTNKRQVKPILCRDEPKDYISFYLSLTNGMGMKHNSAKLKIEEDGACDMIIPSELVKASLANSNRRITHKIKANDSLFKLAKRYYNDGSKWDRIYQANKNSMPNPNSLKIGQELHIPDIALSSNQDEDRSRIIKT